MNRWYRKRPAINGNWERIPLLSVSLTTLTSLHEKLLEMRRKQRHLAEMRQKQLDLLDPLFKPLRDILDFIAPNGVECAVFEEALILRKELYSILELVEDE